MSNSEMAKLKDLNFRRLPTPPEEPVASHTKGPSSYVSIKRNNELINVPQPDHPDFSRSEYESASALESSPMKRQANYKKAASDSRELLARNLSAAAAPGAQRKLVHLRQKSLMQPILQQRTDGLKAVSRYQRNNRRSMTGKVQGGTQTNL